MPSTTVWNQNMGLTGGVREGLSSLGRRHGITGRLQRIEHRLSRLSVLGTAARRPMRDQDVAGLCVVADNLDVLATLEDDDPDGIVPPTICCQFRTPCPAPTGGPA